MAYLYRLCWNDFGWTQLAGVCSHEKGYPKNCCFGYEEWNLDTDACVDGYVYGYVSNLPTGFERHGQTAKVGFWSREPSTGKKLLVGAYLEAEPSLMGEDKTLTKRVHDEFERRGIYEKRMLELYTLGVSYTNMYCISPNKKEISRRNYTFKDVQKAIENMVKGGGLNIRCPKTSVTTFADQPELPRLISGKHVPYRFKAFVDITEADFDRLIAGETTIQNPPIDISTDIGRKQVQTGRVGRRNPHVRDSYPRATTSSIRYIEPKHDKLASDFNDWLRKRGIKPIFEKNYVDAEFIANGEKHMVEAKVVHGLSTRHAIREALGQVIEYNLYPGRTEFSRWFILLDLEPTDEDIEFIETLRNRLGVDLHLIWQDATSDFKWASGDAPPD